MIDLSFSEMLLIAVVAIVVIGPKDLPHVMAKIGRWVGQGKAMVRQFRHGLDEMVRESEYQDMEKRWAEHNRRIMEEHPEAVEDTHAPQKAGAPEAQEDRRSPDADGQEMLPLAPPYPSQEKARGFGDGPRDDTNDDATAPPSRNGSDGSADSDRR